MIDHEHLIDQLDTVRMVSEMLIKAMEHLDKIDSPVHRSFFSTKARFFDLVVALDRYEDAIQKLMDITEEDER